MKRSLGVISLLILVLLVLASIILKPQKSREPEVGHLLESDSVRVETTEIYTADGLNDQNEESKPKDSQELHPKKETGFSRPPDSMTSENANEESDIQESQILQNASKRETNSFDSSGDATGFRSSVAVPNDYSVSITETEGPRCISVSSPNGDWLASLDEAGRLLLSESKALDRQAIEIGNEVLPEIAFSGDSKKLVFAQEREGGDIDLMVISIPPEGDARPAIEWAGTEDRPLFSPDGSHLAFVSGRTGIASLYVLDLRYSEQEPLQMTNVGLEEVERPAGRPPEGFVPPPERDSMTWEGNILTWRSGGDVYQLEVN